MRRVQLMVGALVVALITSSPRAQEIDYERPVATCSTTQVADFTRQIVGDDWEVRCILAAGEDPHRHEIKPDDVQLVRVAHLCIENGLHLEGGDWMRKLATDNNKPLVTCTDGIKLLTIEEDDQVVPDPHGWFSPLNAAVYVRNILQGVTAMDPERESQYRARADLYLAQLRALDAWIIRQCSEIPVEKRLLVTSHDAFGYFCRKYNFKSAAPEGWSTGEEVGGGPTYARRKEAVDSIRQLGVKAIFVETSVNPKLIREIAAEANVELGGTLYSDAMGAPGTAGETYIGMMRENVMTITRALK